MNIKSILIANRGEIAVRIIKTAKRMGIKTFVIKTSKEPKAMYLELADQIIDFTENAEDKHEFLDIDRLIYTIKEYDIDAVHPGYGFLAESYEFAKKCEENKINFIGPSADAIYKMGNKTIAKKIAVEYNIPLLQGSNGNLSSHKRAMVLARKIGYPVIIKAASGGGGRGMRIVEKQSEMEKMYKLATNEAEKAFNDPAVFIEKYIREPRHVEFQILGDKHGNVIHLGERECSIQRKHQKLIEESPSSALDKELRNKMGLAAVQIAKAVQYHSTGTVEFLLDSDKNYYFMEMNTRIQVEHPVTEAITGLDLIEHQIRIANGENLSIEQSDVELNGWSMEFRINAEDVQSGFAPNLGIIDKVVFPSGKYIRIDTGIRNGSQITPYFDSMIAKLIVHAPSRDKVITNSLSALNRFRIKGLKTTIPFHKAVLQNKSFRKGEYNTSFIEKELKQLYFEDPEAEKLAAYLATIDYIFDIEEEDIANVDFEKGKNLTPWLLNKRLKSF
ncbi:acetyl/propionyl/methylcrotonyl-CoA carboxylase subunit alpha [Bacteroidota bacterium]